MGIRISFLRIWHCMTTYAINDIKEKLTLWLFWHPYSLFNFTNWYFCSQTILLYDNKLKVKPSLTLSEHSAYSFFLFEQFSSIFLQILLPCMHKKYSAMFYIKIKEGDFFWRNQRNTFRKLHLQWAKQKHRES